MELIKYWSINAFQFCYIQKTSSLIIQMIMQRNTNTIQYILKLSSKKHQKMQPQEQQKILTSLLKKPENALCADCNSKSPCWASLDFGVFVCMNCSGAHRSLGQSVTRIKSTKLDTWTKEWVWHMQLNNKLINEYYEATLNPVLHKKPNPTSSLNQIKKYVNDKYVRKLFAIQNEDDPITNIKNGRAPLSRLDEAPDSLNKTASEPQKVTVTPPSLNTKKKNESLLSDDMSNRSNKEPSVDHKPKHQINLFEDFHPTQNSSQGQQQNNNGQFLGFTHLYNKNHYNSFSGKGAQHSTTGTLNFDQVFNNSTSPSTQQKQVPAPVNTSFTNLVLQGTNNKYMQQPFTPTVLPSHTSASHGYGQIYHQNYPHMQVHTNSTGVGHHHHHHNTQHGGHPTHVTMNINMNMYGNVMNINLQDPGHSVNQISLNTAPSTNSNDSQKVNLNEHIKLDINDFVTPAKQIEISSKKSSEKSWVDDWK